MEQVKIIYTEDFINFLDELIFILYKEDYFLFLDNSYNYIDKIYDFIDNNLAKFPHIKTPKSLQKHGDFNVFYKSNQRTT